MDDLGKIVKFLDKTSDELATISEKLGKIQEHFNSNLSNVTMVRNDEIEFLQDAFFGNSKDFPEQVVENYRTSYTEQEKIFTKSLGELTQKLAELKEEFGAVDQKRLKSIKKIRTQNLSLDKREEKLKLKVVELDDEINEYNEKISEMNTGFGFISNLPGMRRIQKKKDRLLDKRDELIIQIEEIRENWQKKEVKFSEDTEKIQVDWNEVQVDLSLIIEKIDNLKTNRKIIIEKAAFLNTLEGLSGDEKYLLKKIDIGSVPKCEHCSSENKSNKFFCYYCGTRFSDDRKDIMGSLIEIGELNEVYQRILEGVKGSVSILALMKGIREGVAKFMESVSSVKESQDTYSSLPTLNIPIPGFSSKFAQNITKIIDKIDIPFYNLHPKEFADSFSQYTEKVFTESNIEKFFNKIGDELNKTTKEQW